MSKDQMRYDVLAQDALRQVVRKALDIVSESGLPGDHHFYISFRTKAPGVEMSDRLRGQYPTEMTVVLQHQFWNLHVDDDRFSVELTFNKVPEKLVIPYAALQAFYDPSVQFGLQFNAGEGSPDAARSLGATETKAGDTAKSPASPSPSSKPAVPAGSADVVNLDTFRKK